jgi:hypothetical protein
VLAYIRSLGVDEVEEVFDLLQYFGMGVGLQQCESREWHDRGESDVVLRQMPACMDTGAKNINFIDKEGMCVLPACRVALQK